MIKPQMSKNEFTFWKEEWFLRVPKCKDFVCCHELTSCAVKFLCGCGSLYDIYKTQEVPLECSEVSCSDCLLKYECRQIYEEQT
jgi:hypothetical protein